MTNKKNPLVIFIPFFWLLVFFLIPIFIIFKISLSTPTISNPPYSPHFNTNILKDYWQGKPQNEKAIKGSLSLIKAVSVSISSWFNSISKFTTENYTSLLFEEDNAYISAFISSLKIAFISTLLVLLIGYPMAYAMSKAPDNIRPTLVMLIIIPFWTSFLIRIYSWIFILKPQGLLNYLLIYLGLINSPLEILNTQIAIYIGIVYSYLPFMILPLYTNLIKQDPSLTEAAMDLGCSPFRSFWKITLPLSKPGIIAGCFLVFIPAVGEFIIPDLLGGSEIQMIGNTLWIEFFQNSDWPKASAVAFILIILLILPLVLFQNISIKKGTSKQ